MGCQLSVTLEGGDVKNVEGATCKKGIDYAKVECTNPTRIVTSTIRLKGAPLCALPVKTEAPIPKGKIAECMQALKGIEISAPVSIGAIIIENICGTGINIIATRGI
ncbi:MAG: DUF1667 domain-containing protein [Clostridiales bacterium]|jgi:CxxC motif-containing protein|nr:DUF1667 domain-containing protein [Clostridiales bacterium]